MSLARCLNKNCFRILDIPQIPGSYRQVNGLCADCHLVLSDEDKLAMDIPPEVTQAITKKTVFKVDHGVAIKPETNIKVQSGVPLVTKNAPKPKLEKKYKGEYPFDKLGAPHANGDMDSFFVPLADGDDVVHHGNRIGQRGIWYARTFGEKKIKFAVRTVVENGVRGTRVWRTK